MCRNVLPSWVTDVSKADPSHGVPDRLNESLEAVPSRSRPPRGAPVVSGRASSHWLSRNAHGD